MAPLCKGGWLRVSADWGIVTLLVHRHPPVRPQSLRHGFAVPPPFTQGRLLVCAIGANSVRPRGLTPPLNCTGAHCAPLHRNHRLHAGAEHFNRGEASRPLPFLLLQQPAQRHQGFLCATSTSIFDTLLQLLQIMPQKRQFVRFLKQKPNNMVT